MSELNTSGYTHESVYVGIMGPTYETHSESLFLRVIGADVVGMSTVHEAVVAKHANMKVFGMSLITDMSSAIEDSEAECTHEEVLAISSKRAEIMKEFVKQFVRELKTSL